MIIFAKADGTVINTQPTPIYQGSSLKGSVYLVAPFPNSNGVTIQFQLPNGNVTKAYPMTPTGEIEGLKLDNKDLSIWVWDVANAMITAIPGTVMATIKVIDTNENVTSIISSFSVIKGTPSELPSSVPSPSEWNIIVSLYGEVASKVAYPLMTNFEYNPLTGESKKTYNNGSIQEETFPAINQNGFVEYNSFTETDFKISSWTISNTYLDYEYVLEIPASSLEIPASTIATTNFDVAIFKVEELEEKAEKMNPLIVIDKANSRVLVYSKVAYSGYALFFWKGSFVEQNYLPSIESAIHEAKVVTIIAENATERANSISRTLEDAYANGEFVIPEGGTEGQVLTKTASGTAWEDAEYCMQVYPVYGPYNYEVDYLIGDISGYSKIEIVASMYYDAYSTSVAKPIFTSKVIYENGVKYTPKIIMGISQNQAYQGECTVMWSGNNSIRFNAGEVTGFMEGFADYNILILKFTK